MTALLIGGYILAGIVSVPFLARSFYEPAFEVREAAVGLAIVNAVLWPIWAGIGAVVLASKLLAPLIFHDDKEGSDG